MARYENSIKTLTAKGYKIKVTYFRVFEKDGQRVYVQTPAPHLANEGWQMLAKGGDAAAAVASPDGFEAETRSWCSRLDTFNKSIARSIAIGRAMRHIEYQRKEAAAAM